jgi:protein TonB
METVIAMRESSSEENKGGDSTAHRAYLGKLRTHLERSKVNPRTTLIGTAVVRLTVKSDGELVSHRIVKSSGSKLLDNAALASIEKASPFPEIPSEVGRDTIEVSVPFRFTVR